jgi:hypothetical protein
MRKENEETSRLYAWRFPLFVVAAAFTIWGLYDFRVLLKLVKHHPLAATTSILFGASSLAWGAFLRAYWSKMVDPRAFSLINRWAASGTRPFFLFYFWGLVAGGIIFLAYGVGRLTGAG